MKSTVKSKKKANGWIKILLALGIILYILAMAAAIFGIFSIVWAQLGAGKLFSGFDPENIEEIMEELFGEDVSIAYGGMFMVGIALVLTVIGTVFIITYKQLAVKQKKQEEEDSLNEVLDQLIEETSSTEEASVVEIEQPEEEVVTEHIFCAYCGEELDPKDKRCPNCGATKKIKKKV